MLQVLLTGIGIDCGTVKGEARVLRLPCKVTTSLPPNKSVITGTAENARKTAIEKSSGDFRMTRLLPLLHMLHRFVGLSSCYYFTITDFQIPQIKNADMTGI